MSEYDDERWVWTPEGADKLRAAGAALAEGVIEHVEAVCAARDEAHSREVFDASQRLQEVAVAYGQAQLEYTRYGFPMLALEQYLEDDEEADDAEPEPPAGLSVLSRRDYEVVDEQAVMRAGRAAYLRVWPDDDETAAAADVTHLGRALYQLAHADGWDSLDGVDGLSVVAASTFVLQRDELLDLDAADSYGDVFDADDAEMIYRQDDVYRY